MKFYLEELRNYFDELVFLTNHKSLYESETLFLKQRDIEFRLVENEGYDFGMWYKALKQIDVTHYYRIGLVNDSCVLFRRLQPFFEWLESGELDYCGMLDSKDIAYHIQSYFVIVNQRAISPVRDYFMEKGIVKSTDIWDIIRTYEIGLSTHLAEQGLRLGAYFKYDGYLSARGNNIAYFSIAKLVNDGLPIIKKTLIFNVYRESDLNYLWSLDFNTDSRQYIRLMESAVTQSRENINVKQLLKDYPGKHWSYLKLQKKIRKRRRIGQYAEPLVDRVYRLLGLIPSQEE